jgi:hypothetical protein
MNIYNIILLIFVCLLLHHIFFKDNKIEEFANDWNHYAWMSDYGVKMREEGLKKIFKFYGMDEDGQVKDDKEKKEAFKVEGKSELEKEEQKKPIVEVKEFQLEDPNKKILAKYSEEVDEYNSGSGNLANINKAYEAKDKKKYAKELETLYSRGGNVHIRKE